VPHPETVAVVGEALSVGVDDGDPIDIGMAGVDGEKLAPETESHDRDVDSHCSATSCSSPHRYATPPVAKFGTSAFAALPAGEASTASRSARDSA